jgi:phosphoesterase RecJ-like protein
MPKNNLQIEELKEKLNSAKSISILTHLNPDADTIGTGLGIYNLLIKDKTKRVEIVNGSKEMPKHLDFLSGFNKIKNKIDFEDSTIISCDCGSIDRLGFDLEGRDIINIDHHNGNTYYGSLNIVVADYASASQVAYEVFREFFTITSTVATCFYTALLSDTRYFTTNNVNQEVFRVANELVSLGANPNEVAFNFTQRRALSSIRILQKALANIELHCEAKVVSSFVTQKEIEETGAKMPDMEGIVDYGRSLVTVEVSVFVIELNNSLRVSLRSKTIDISSLAKKFGGGGHKLAAGFTTDVSNLEEIIDIIVKNIKGLLIEKK